MNEGEPVSAKEKGVEPVNAKSRYLARGALIKRVRRELGISQTELGKLVAIAVGRPIPYQQSWISDVENGRGGLWGVEKVLADVLHLSEDQLLQAAPEADPEISRQTTTILQRVQRERLAPSEVLIDTFGTGDALDLIKSSLGLKLAFRAPEAAYQHSIMLTRFPISLGGAISMALAREGIFEYESENFSGRVCSWQESATGNKFSLAFVFSNPRIEGFLIYMERDQLSRFKDELIRLPLHDLQTD